MVAQRHIMINAILSALDERVQMRRVRAEQKFPHMPRREQKFFFLKIQNAENLRP